MNNTNNPNGNREIMLNQALSRIENVWYELPFEYRGIKIDHELIKVTLDILNYEPSKKLPQNPRNAVVNNTPDGLDKRIKVERNSNLRTANIISDVLAYAEIVEIEKTKNPLTNRSVKGTKLKNEWSW